MTYTRINDTDARKQQILDAGIEIARDVGYAKVTREQVAAKIKCSVGTITHRCGTMKAFRRSLMRAAVQRADLKIIAQGLVAGDAYAKKAPEDVKRKALAAIATA